MNNLITNTKKQGIKCAEKSNKNKYCKKVNNTKSTTFKSCAQDNKSDTTMYRQLSSLKNSTAKASFVYTQVIQQRKTCTKTNKQLSHIYTLPSNTSSVINIYKIDVQTTKLFILIKLLKGESNSKIRIW